MDCQPDCQPSVLPQVNDEFDALRIDEIEPIPVGPGCYRRDLPGIEGLRGLRAWVVDMDPGSVWPHLDHHPDGEAYVVLQGEVFEGERRCSPGTYVVFRSGTSHRPRTEQGVRLFGFNPDARSGSGSAWADPLVLKEEPR